MCDSGAANSVLRRFTIQVAELLEGEEEITVLHVMSQISAGPGVPDSQLSADVQELIADDSPEGRLLSQDLRLLDRHGIHPIAKVRHGLVVDEIIAEAHNGDYDLVVIGAHHEQGWQRFLLDDLAHKILAQVDRPVLVVR
jgi:nucleotide-binding universal stress UspA family protein